MWERKPNNHTGPENSCYVSRGAYATLVLPGFLSFNFTIALFDLLIGMAPQNEVSPILMIATITLLILPIILILSIGMFWGVKTVSKALIKTSHYKPIGVGTIIKLWLSYLSKLHLLWFGFYLFLAIIWLITIQFMPLEDVHIGIFDDIGIPEQAGVSLVFFIAILAYIVMFGGMAYVLATLPLALISAVIFRIFTKVKSA